jgi:hypothetical protein
MVNERLLRCQKALNETEIATEKAARRGAMPAERGSLTVVTVVLILAIAFVLVVLLWPLVGCLGRDRWPPLLATLDLRRSQSRMFHRQGRQPVSRRLCLFRIRARQTCCGEAHDQGRSTEDCGWHCQSAGFRGAGEGLGAVTSDNASSPLNKGH